MGNGHMGNGHMGNGHMGNGHMGNGHMGNGHMGNGICTHMQPGHLWRLSEDPPTRYRHIGTAT